MGKVPNSDLSRQLRAGTEISLEPSGSWLPLAQNNPFTTEAQLGVTCSEPL